MGITEDQAKRWGVYRRPEQPYSEQETDDRGRLVGAELELEPGVEKLLDVLKALNHESEMAKQNLKEAAVKLMENDFISISRLARVLGVSRQTLYQWRDEIQEYWDWNVRPTDPGGLTSMKAFGKKPDPKRFFDTPPFRDDDEDEAADQERD